MKYPEKVRVCVFMDLVLSDAKGFYLIHRIKNQTNRLISHS